MKTDREEFEQRNVELTEAMAKDQGLTDLSRQWLNESCKYEYSYHFSWLGMPVIQYPQDIIAIQELIWRIKPDYIVETGIARGGSLVLSASILELIGGAGRVIGIDVDIRPHNREAIEQHPLSRRIEMLEGSSTDPKIVDQIAQKIAGRKTLVFLDSNHTHDHVLKELELYSSFVGKDSYLVVFDTIIEHLPPDSAANRPWGKGNNPITAVQAFLKTNDRFVIDRAMENKLLITVAPSGYLKCIKDPV